MRGDAWFCNLLLFESASILRGAIVSLSSESSKRIGKKAGGLPLSYARDLEGKEGRAVDINGDPGLVQLLDSLLLAVKKCGSVVALV